MHWILLQEKMLICLKRCLRSASKEDSDLPYKCLRREGETCFRFCPKTEPKLASGEVLEKTKIWLRRRPRLGIKRDHEFPSERPHIKTELNSEVNEKGLRDCCGIDLRMGLRRAKAMLQKCFYSGIRKAKELLRKMCIRQSSRNFKTIASKTLNREMLL